MADYSTWLKLMLLIYIVKRIHIIEVQCYLRSQHKKLPVKNVLGQRFEYRCERGEMKQYLNYDRQRLLMRLKPQETHYSLELNMVLYNFDNNTEFKCTRECTDCAYDYKVVLHESETYNENTDSLDGQDFIIYNKNMSFRSDCKGHSAYWILLDGDNKILNKTSLNANMYLDIFWNNTKLICIYYECNTRYNITTCTRIIQKYITFLTYNQNINTECKQPLIAYLSLGGIVGIIFLVLLYKILKKPRPQLPLPEEARTTFTYSVAYDHVTR